MKTEKLKAPKTRMTPMQHHPEPGTESAYVEGMIVDIARTDAPEGGVRRVRHMLLNGQWWPIETEEDERALIARRIK